MSHYIAKIDRLSAVAGYSTNPLEKVPLMILEDEIENLLVDNESKRKTIQILEERLEKIKIATKAEKELHGRLSSEIRGDIEKFNQKNMILIQYHNTIGSDDFELNKLKQVIEKHHEEFYVNIKLLIDKARSVNEEVKKLQELQTKCDQLKQKTGQ